MKEKTAANQHYRFFDRDISWLSFNERVLMEAKRKTVPLMERIKFLAIYSSNLDEFYRVRMPTLRALTKLSGDAKHKSSEASLAAIDNEILRQLTTFGEIMTKEVLPELRRHNVTLLYGQALPEAIVEALKRYFIHTVATFIQIHRLGKDVEFFPENNKLYLVVRVRDALQTEHFYFVNIPSDSLSRFVIQQHDGTQYIVFLDDIVRLNLPFIFPGQYISSYSFKITRNAELDLEDEFTGNLARKIEKKIAQRDFGLATRFLYEPGFPEDALLLLKKRLNLGGASFIEGGSYHNLKDLSMLPLKDSSFHYEPWPKLNLDIDNNSSLFEEIKKRDVLLHPPYHSYDAVLRFFNEAAIDGLVETIYITLYRVANESRIVNALISAAKNGKRVVVFVELKARFDEANNLRWSRKMRDAGVQIIESIPGLKVHAKIALVKRKAGKKRELFGLLSTGNFNEITSKFYTDHILMTSDNTLLAEAEFLFSILQRRKAKLDHEQHPFRYLLVGQFNLQERFLELIDREIAFAKNGQAASITIKFNNLEERVLILKLYEASNAGVKISLIVRGICCLVPGVPAMSENITVKRIVDRYLEHGRVFIFNNNNDSEVYLGSADWMNRNVYRRIEVCFPVRDRLLKNELINIVNIQLSDNYQAVTIDDQCRNQHTPVDPLMQPVRSQLDIARTLGEYRGMLSRAINE
jgi:polyphosphate kinase